MFQAIISAFVWACAWGLFAIPVAIVPYSISWHTIHDGVHARSGKHSGPNWVGWAALALFVANLFIILGEGIANRSPEYGPYIAENYWGGAMVCLLVVAAVSLVLGAIVNAAIARGWFGRRATYYGA